MRTNRIAAACAAALVAAGLAPATQGRERPVDVDELPVEITRAAQQGLPGFEIKEAEIEETGSGTFYELEGLANGKDYEMKLNSKGEVLGIHRGERQDQPEGGKKDDDSDDTDEGGDDDSDS